MSEQPELLKVPKQPNGPKRGKTMADNVTANGYRMDEVRSALQKAIRRGQEMEALFWSKEIASFGWGKYLWKSLFVIVAEDIGIANPDLPGQVLALKLMSDVVMKKQSEVSVDHLAMAILLMCRSPKNREAADFESVVETMREQGWRLEVPDEALDSHTRRGRKMGRDERFFQREGRKVIPEVGELTYKAQLKDLWAINEMA